jgi:hypothetical protein
MNSILMNTDRQLKRKIVNSKEFIDSLFEMPFHLVLSKVLKQLKISRYGYSLMLNFSVERLPGAGFGMFFLEKTKKELIFLSNFSSCCQLDSLTRFPVYVSLLHRLAKEKHDSILSRKHRTPVF